MYQDVMFDFEVPMKQFPLKKFETLDQEVVITSKNIHQYHPNYLKKLTRVHFVGVDMYEHSVQQRFPNVEYFTYTEEPIVEKRTSKICKYICIFLFCILCISFIILTIFIVLRKELF